MDAGSINTRMPPTLEIETPGFSAFLEAVPVGIAVINMANGRLVQVNSRLCGLTGYSCEELLQMSLAQIAHVSGHAGIEEAYCHLRDGSEGEQLLETRAVPKDGGTIWLRMTLKTLPSSGSACVAVIEDVTTRKQTEERLRILAAVAENSDNFVGICTPDCLPLFVNESGRRMLGLASDEDVASSSLLDYLSPEDRPLIENHVIPVLLREGRWSGKLHFRHFKSGAPIPTLCNAFVIRNEVGELVAWATISPDVTQLKNAEDALRRSEAKYRSFFENLREMVMLYEPVRDAQGNIVDWICRDANQGALRVLDLTREQLNGRRGSEIFGEKMLAQTLEPMTKVLETGEAIRFEGHRRGRNYEVSIFRSEDMVATSAIDITGRKRAEKALRESEQRLRLILEANPIGAVLGDASGRVLEANDAYLRLIGRTRDDLRAGNLRWDSITPPEYLPLDQRAIAEARAKGVSALYEKAYVRSDGGRVPVLVACASVGEQGELAAFVLDITERKHAEETLREADRRKDEFLAMLAHELRNPLAAISNAVAIVTRLPLPDNPQLTRMQGIIERQTRHLARLVDDLLDVSRITRGKVVLRKEPLALADILTRAADTVRPLVAARSHEFSVLVSPEPVWLLGDEVRLIQVFGNILNNAAKYTPDGGSIRVTGEGAEGEAIVRIADSGIGISPALLPHVFDLFTQAERGLDRAEGGLGIGLTIVKSLVEMHGGSVRAESTPGHGSTFEVRLPTVQPPSVGVEAGAPSEAAASLRLLVVDDNRDAAESLAVLLRLNGHTVRIALNARDGIEAARSFHPQAILLDIGMPGMDGYELAERLRKMPETSAVTLIAVSGYQVSEDGRGGERNLFDEYLVKPVDFTALDAVLQRIEPQ